MRTVQQKVSGGPEVLEVVESPAPRPDDLGPDEVLVRVHAAGLNPIDVQTREGGGVAGLMGEPPITLGWDLAGVVEARGDAVDGLEVGSRVFGMASFPYPARAYAEYAVVPARDLVPVPDTVSDEEAGAAPMGALTAWQALHDVAGIRRGDRVLVAGAGGGVGHLAVQIAVAVGAEVIAVAGADKHAWLRELGASQVIDHRSQDAVKVLREAPVDIVFSLQRGPAVRGLVAALRAGGIIVESATGSVTDEVRAAADAAGVRTGAVAVHPDREQLAGIADLLSRGVVRVEVSRVFVMDEVTEAHQALEAGHTRGKTVLRTIDTIADDAGT